MVARYNIMQGNEALGEVAEVKPPPSVLVVLNVQNTP